MCTLGDNCYVSPKGKTLELQQIVHTEIYMALVITWKLDGSIAHSKYTKTCNFTDEEWTTGQHIH